MKHIAKETLRYIAYLTDDQIPQYIKTAINILVVLVIIAFILACMWTYELHKDPVVMDVQQAFKDIEDYSGWTDAEVERIKERKAFLIQCEKNIVKVDKALALYGKHIVDQKDFIEEYGE